MRHFDGLCFLFSCCIVVSAIIQSPSHGIFLFINHDDGCQHIWYPYILYLFSSRDGSRGCAPAGPAFGFFGKASKHRIFLNIFITSISVQCVVRCLPSTAQQKQ